MSVRVIGDRENPESLVEAKIAPLYRRGRDFVRHGKADTPEQFADDVLSRAERVDHEAGVYLITVREWNQIRHDWTGGEVLKPIRPWWWWPRQAVPWLGRGAAVGIGWGLAGPAGAGIAALLAFWRIVGRVLYILSFGAIILKRPEAPGGWLASTIQISTLGRVRPCTKCKSRAKAMDRAGWRGLPRLWWRWAGQWLAARKGEPE